jgi:ribosomal-protein-alanine N-acetyltransferase
MSEVRTERLRLRGWEADDADALAAILTPSVTRWLSSWPDPMTAEIARARIASMQTSIQQGRGLEYAIVCLDDDRLIGGLAVKLTEERPDYAKLGYYLAEGCQGRGYMREAVQAAITETWRRFPVEIIEAGAQLENAASFAVMRALGMQAAGERRVHASARDRDELCLFYQLRRPGPD